ncbi:cobaltochelatase subunit CobN [Acetobacter indonesiensis]|uniref:cobaltochelatase subunit CobN n=1 Tax=Acetobacter indonesiensis TaxID=104101 RepID=UPI000A390075|nr:cobaltochelatase subunit CobN [Acetobacter indonesiensis]
MHLLVRENRTIDEQDEAEDLGLPSADLVVLSFTESDLLGLQYAHARLQSDAEDGQTLPSLQVTHLARLRHPMSVDLYLETTLEKARCVVVRLLGGLEYWRYGAEELATWCREHKVPLALLPGDCVQTQGVRAIGRDPAVTGDYTSPAADDEGALAALSTVSAEIRSRLTGFFRHGGPENMMKALRLMGAVAGLNDDAADQPEDLPSWGLYRTVQARSVVAFPDDTAKTFSVPVLPEGTSARAVLVFYRAHLLVSDCAAFDALSDYLAAQGCTVDLLFVTSLKDAAVASGVAGFLQTTQPDIILNGTVFSSKNQNGISPLTSIGAPILQLLQPNATYAVWARSPRGLSRSDLAMQVVLPELDGSIATLPLSFREDVQTGQPGRREPYLPGIEQTAARALAWIRLRKLPADEKRLAIVVSDYPGAGLQQESGHVAHAVGLDAFASLHSILTNLKQENYSLGSCALPNQKILTKALTDAPVQSLLSVEDYKKLTAKLDDSLMAKVHAAWGEPEQDRAVQNTQFCLRVLKLGNMVVAVQPDRAASAERKALYHDPDSPPCHAYIAFYLWLQHVWRCDALVHLGTHGTLEWLPGKAAALSPSCAAAALTGAIPVIYPFIVNNPGEAAAAKRRLGAVIIGHMTPPVMQAELSADMQALERLIDEYAEADGLDPRRGALLRKDILNQAARTGLLSESGVRPGDEDEVEALARLDAYLCDVKDLQIRDGLHIFGKPAPKAKALVDAIEQACSGSAYSPESQPDYLVKRLEIERKIAASAPAESNALRDALAGRFVAAGPAGAPTRGRVDVLPTGRNLFTIDPRALPTPSAMLLAAKMEKLLLTRNLQEQGEPLTHLVMDLWGSASLRTGGEDMALALRLMGVTVQRAAGTGHVSGFEIIPLPVLDRPRVDVTLRISGLFRDAFPDQIALFDQVVSAVAARDEPPEWNPLAAAVKGLEGEARIRASARIFGAASGTYGTGVEKALQQGGWQTQADLGQAWLDGSAWTYGGGRDGQQDADTLASLLGQANAILHVQDHAETDMLESPDNAAHEGGLAAAAAVAGGQPAQWHGDTSRPEAPKLRATAQEVARVVRGRLANPRWIEGMQRHGYAGAAELARGLDALHGFAATLPERFDQQFDLVFAATLGNEECDAFLQDTNPAARAAMCRRFVDAWQRGLWHPKSNSVIHTLDAYAQKQPLASDTSKQTNRTVAP